MVRRPRRRRPVSTSSTSTACRARFYYPEIMPPGVALFDYDNDGDLDVFSSRDRCSARQAARRRAVPAAQSPSLLRGRLFRNDLQIAADGTRALHFTDVTGASGIDARGYGMGVGDRRLRQRRLRRSLRHQPRPQPAVPQQLRRHVHRRHEAERHGRLRAGACRRRSSTIDRDGWLDLFVGNYLQLQRSPTNIRCFGLAGRPRLLPAARLSRRSRAACIATTATARSPTSPPAPAWPREFGPALGVATADFNGDGWIDIYVANDGAAEPAVDQPAQRHVQEHGAARGRGAERGRTARRRAWASTPATSTTTATRICSSTELTGAGQQPVRQRRVGRLRGPERPLRPRPRQPAVHRLRHGVARRRQRRLARPADGQRRGDADARGGRAARSLSAAAAKAAVPQPRQRALRGRHRPRRRGLPAGGGRPRRGVRRRRQRRRHRRRGRQRQRPGAPAGQRHRPAETLDRPAARRRARRARHGRGARRDRPDRWRRRSGAARDPMAATRRRTIPGCSPASAICRRRRPSASTGRTAASRNGAGSRSIATRRCSRAPERL